MDRNEIDRLLTTFGADLERWPAHKADQARALIDLSDEARAMFAEARALDDVLDTLGDDGIAGAMPDALTDRIVAATVAIGASETNGTEYRAPLMKLVMSAAASLVIGISVGLTDLGQADVDGDSDAVSLAFGLTNDNYNSEDSGDSFDGEEL